MTPPNPAAGCSLCGGTRQFPIVRMDGIIVKVPCPGCVRKVTKQ